MAITEEKGVVRGVLESVGVGGVGVVKEERREVADMRSVAL